MGGDIGEGSIAIIVIEAQRGPGFLVAWPVAAVDQQNVLPPIAIVVEKGAARAQSFGEKFPAEGSAIVWEVNARWPGHVGEVKSQRGRGSGLRDKTIQSKRNL